MAITINEEIQHTSVKKITFDWTAVTTGTTSGSSTGSYDGEVLRVVAANTLCAGGTFALYDSDENDLLMGRGTITTGSTYFCPTTDGAIDTLGAITNSTLKFEHSNCTTNGTGSVYIYIR